MTCIGISTFKRNRRDQWVKLEYEESGGRFGFLNIFVF